MSFEVTANGLEILDEIAVKRVETLRNCDCRFSYCRCCLSDFRDLRSHISPNRLLDFPVALVQRDNVLPERYEQPTEPRKFENGANAENGREGIHTRGVAFTRRCGKALSGD